MKRKTLSTLLLASIMGLFAAFPFANSVNGSAEFQWTPGQYMAQSVARVMKMVQYITDKTDREWGYDDGISIWGAYLSRSGQQVGLTTYLEGSRNYAFIGGGDEDAIDVDVYVEDAQGNRLARDTKTDATPLVTFTPPQSGKYKLRLRLYKARRGSFCALAILKRKGWNVPIENLGTALSNCIKFGTALDREVRKRGGKGVYFNEEPNQWSLWGGVLRSGEQSTLTNIRMGSGVHTILSAADNHANDLDLYLTNNSGGVLAQFEKRSKTPFIVRETAANTNYGLRIKNYASNGASLVITTVLDVNR